MDVNDALDAARSMVIAVLLSLHVIAGASIAGRADEQPAPVTIVAFGDSLTAGYGVKPGQSFPAQLQMALAAKGRKVTIVNAGVSGDTTSGGLGRLDWSLDPTADGVILELGANDALRGIDPKEPRANLDKMLAMITAKKLDVLIAGMKSPSNWGPEYVKSFDAIYPDLAAKYGAALYPFFLDGVALDPALVQADGLHPTAAGVAEIVKRMMPDVEALLDRIEKRKAAAGK
jgi:acyl-CoA thioesterase-1